MFKHILFYFFSFFFFLFSSASGDIINVPADQPTIQDGINAAVNGDLVLVAEGTYYENINFMGKAITVASHFYLDQNKKHIRKTIIDGSQPLNPDFGSVVSFMSFEDTNSVICGFTITRGTGTILNVPGLPEIRIGGGVNCFLSGAKICHNIFKENIIQGNGFAIGAGIGSGPPGFPANIVIEFNTFTHNEVYGVFMADGGGLSNSYPGRIVHNEMDHNYVFSEQGIASGGGLSAFTSQDPSTPPMIISGNTITHNKIVTTTMGPIGAVGGGMEIYGFNILVNNNLVTHNEVSSANDASYGAGVVLDFPNPGVIFQNNVVSHNIFSGTGGCFGGAIAIWDGDASVFNNILSHNKASKGAGIYITIENTISRPQIVNNTIAHNEATIAGGGVFTNASEPTVMNSIFWKNLAPAGPQIFVDGGTIFVTYSDIQGGWPGMGNLNVNPRLFAPLLFLGFKSPGIDAGNPDPLYNDPESPFLPGYAQLPARGMVRNDMGAYGGPGASGWWNFLNFARELQAMEYDQPELVSEKQESTVQAGAYPNPFNNETTIQFGLPEGGSVRLNIFNVLGQEVASLVDGELPAGSYRYRWNAADAASGIYFYRLEINGQLQQNKLILMK